MNTGSVPRTMSGRKTNYIKASDIKHKDRLTSDLIALISYEKVYEWIRTGQWKQKDFVKWLNAIRVIE